MRFIDRWVGGLLILLLAPWAALNRRSPIPHVAGFGPNPPPTAGRIPRPPSRAPSLIVVSKYFGMGSILLAVPLLRQLRSQFPSARIVFVSFSTNRDLLAYLPYLDEVLSIRTSPLAFGWDTVKVWWALRRRRPDLYFDLEFFSRYSALMNYGSGAATRVGFHTMSLQARGRLLTHRVYWNPSRHAAENFLALGAAVGVPAGAPILGLRTLSASEEAAGLTWLRQQGIVTPYVLFGPQANTVPHLNSYPPDQWLALAAQLHERLGCQILCVGATPDPRWIPPRPSTQPYLLNLSGRIEFQILAILIQRAAAVVSVDNGLAHLAAVFHVPAVTLFGPETPTIFRPLNPRGVVLYADLHCSPCINVLEGKRSDCRDNVCVTRWSAKEVCERVLTVMRAATLSGLGGRAPERLCDISGPAG